MIALLAKRASGPRPPTARALALVVGALSLLAGGCAGRT